jgi:hypothetical protein
MNIMTKWKKDQKEFVVSVTYHDRRGCQCYLPKPMTEIMGKPSRIRFIVRIEIEAGE